ncbi:MAG: aquaporin [Candidatus Binatia bacterium]
MTGATAAALVLASWVVHPAVNYVVTAPGGIGRVAAFLAEVLITFILMTVILRVSNQPRLDKFTGLCAGLLVAFYITFEAPISGMSRNPARSFASAVSARLLRSGDLLHRTADRHVVRRRSSSASRTRAPDRLRQAAPRQLPALHFLRQARQLAFFFFSSLLMLFCF